MSNFTNFGVDGHVSRADQGCRLPPEPWAWLNREGAFSDPRLREFVAPFPPVELMKNVSGLVSERDFAAHGAHFWLALSKLAPRPLAEFRTILDLGCGSGRLGRMFKGYPGTIYGCDIDARHVEWIRNTLSFYDAQLTRPDASLPYASGRFDLILSISIFTHLSESSQDILLAELHRITERSGLLMLSIHGERALERVANEKPIYELISVERRLFEQATRRFARGEHAFILQDGHLTTHDFQYGITFIPKTYIASHWTKWFHIEQHASGALHDFQDVILLRPR